MRRRLNPGLMLATALAAGFLAYFLLERFTSFHEAREHEHHAATPHAPELGMLGASGLAIHSFLDGVAIGVDDHHSVLHRADLLSREANFARA